MAQTLRVGAGGRWRVYNERFDPLVVKQQSDVSCGPACGEMLLADRGVEITQEIIEQASYAPIEVIDLAKTLNALDSTVSRRWEGGGIYIPGASDESLVRTLNNTGSWSAVMWEQGARIGHLVIIDGFHSYGRLRVRDPWEGTSYTMDMKDFLEVWSGVAVYARSLK